MAKQKRKRGVNGLPWYRVRRDCWIVPGDPKKTPIRNEHGEIVRGKGNQQAALAAWHAMTAMANAGRAGDENDVKTVLNLYLSDAQGRISEKSFDNYRKYFQSFCDKFPGLAVADLKPYHVKQWWDGQERPWGPSVRNYTGGILKAAFSWASKQGRGGAIISSNPLHGMPLPTMGRRHHEAVVADEDFAKLMAVIESEAVRDILNVAWVTGTRPVNLSRAMAADLNDNGTALVIEEHKTAKKTGRPHTLILPAGEARDIVLRLVERHPQGPIFRTTRGFPWDEHKLASLVWHYAKKAGVRFTAYFSRHTRTTRLIEGGMAVTDVAAIMGNTPSTIAKNYDHTKANVNRLLNLREKAETAR